MNTHVLGISTGGALFRWKWPSRKIPFFPLHLRKNRDFSNRISTWARLMKLEFPRWMSTLPWVEELRPIMVVLFRTRNSNSFPRIFAKAWPPASFTLNGEFEGSFNANNAQASALSSWSKSDILFWMFCYTIPCLLWSVGGSSSAGPTPR